MSGPRLSGKLAVVTAAASGIGAAAAGALAAAGAHVMLADADPAGAAVAESLAKAGLSAEFVLHDVGEEASWISLLTGIEAASRRLDVLVNGPGIMEPALLPEATLEALRRMARVNVEGVFLGIKHAVAHMVRGAGAEETPRGSIVNVSSTPATAAGSAAAGVAAFCATQGAVRILSKSAAVECGARRHHIRVNCVHAGWIGAAAGGAAPGAAPGGRIPLRRAGAPADVAGAVLYLASDESRLVTGTVLAVDGGWSAS
jgi:NAD(P)-dependent dehydrogenase (short-subunit alcohol dehydrogenase family)